MLKNLINDYGLSQTCTILFGKSCNLKDTKNGSVNIGFLENRMVITNEMIIESKERFEKLSKLKSLNFAFSKFVIRLTLTIVIKNALCNLRFNALYTMM